MEFSIIVAMDSKRGIGSRGNLPWRLKGDMEHFKRITTGNGSNAVVMGSTTWKSLPENFRPLPNRLNLVLSRQVNMQVPEGALAASSLEEALLILEQKSIQEIFVIGGGSVYTEAIQHQSCSKLYITQIASTFDCDTFFPEIPPSFTKAEESVEMKENEIHYTFVTYEKET